MSNAFSEKSKEIATNFIQSVFFVDDQAYSLESNDLPFDVKQVVTESANRGLIAAAFSPQHLNDLEPVVAVGKKADVIVLDWRMRISSESDQEDDDDDDVTDPRGSFAINVIKALMSDTVNGQAADQLKLLFIYTGERGLDKISDDLEAKFSDFTKINEFTFVCGGVRVSIWAKEVLAPSFKHMPEYRKRLRSYTELLDEIPIEYAEISSGLLSNTCLEALTSIRNNTYKLLANFSSSLDPAFAAHRAMLPKPEDAGDFLKETICGEINSILTNANIAQCVSSKSMQNWISIQDFVATEITVKKRTHTADPVTVTIDNDKREAWQDKGYIDLLRNEKDGDGSPKLKKEDIKNCERGLLKKHACSAFMHPKQVKSGINEDFSILTHHRRNYLNSERIPSLSLGVVIKGKDRFLLCIQPRCDSVRIPDGELRKFIFLPMKKNDQNFDLLFKNSAADYTYLSVCDKECYALEIIDFIPVEGAGVVQAQNENGVYNFNSGFNRETKYQWILDLKDAHAQRIANKFAANLARVGLNESEWLRR